MPILVVLKENNYQPGILYSNYHSLVRVTLYVIIINIDHGTVNHLGMYIHWGYRTGRHLYPSKNMI